MLMNTSTLRSRVYFYAMGACLCRCTKKNYFEVRKGLSSVVFETGRIFEKFWHVAGWRNVVLWIQKN